MRKAPPRRLRCGLWHLAAGPAGLAKVCRRCHAGAGVHACKLEKVECHADACVLWHCMAALLCAALQVHANSLHILSPWDLAVPAGPAQHDGLRMPLAADPKGQLSALCEAVATCMQPLQAPQDVLLALLLSAATVSHCPNQPESSAAPTECCQASQ